MCYWPKWIIDSFWLDQQGYPYQLAVVWVGIFETAVHKKICRVNLFCWIVNNIFALPIITLVSFPTYPLIFPEKNHGILAGKYDAAPRDDSGWSQQLSQNFSKLRHSTKLFCCVVLFQSYSSPCLLANSFINHLKISEAFSQSSYRQ